MFLLGKKALEQRQVLQQIAFVKGAPFAVLVRCDHGLTLEHTLTLQTIPACTQRLERASSDTTTCLLAEKQAFSNCFYYPNQLSVSILHCSKQCNQGRIFPLLAWSAPISASVLLTALLGTSVDPCWTPLGQSYCKNTLCFTTWAFPLPANCHREDTALEKEVTKWMWMPLRDWAMLLAWGQVQKRTQREQRGSRARLSGACKEHQELSVHCQKHWNCSQYLSRLLAQAGKPRPHQLPPQKHLLGKGKPALILCALWENLTVV